MFDDRPPLHWGKKRRKPRKKARRNISEAALIDRAMFDDRPPLDWGDSPPSGRREVRGISTGKRRRGGSSGGSKPSDYMFPEILRGNWKYKKVYDAVSAYLGGQRNYAKLTWFAQEAESKGKRLTNIGALITMGLEPESAFMFLNAMGKEFPSTTTTSEGKRRVVFNAITPQIQAAARRSLNMFLGDTRANPRSRRNPQTKVYPGPWIGYPKYYEVASNAGPFTPEIFPFGQAGRPATYTVVPSEATQIKQLLPVKVVKNPRRNPSYAIPLQFPKWEYDVWAAKPTQANWTTYPTYSYQQFYRTNPAKRNRQTREGYIEHGSGPRGGLTPAERKSIPSQMFLEPKTRSFPVQDRNHAWIAVQYMTRFHIPNAPTLIRRLAKFYPPSDPQNAKIWDRYKRLRKKIEKMSGKNMPTFSQLKGRKARKAAANPQRRRRAPSLRDAPVSVLEELSERGWYSSWVEAEEAAALRFAAEDELRARGYEKIKEAGGQWFQVRPPSPSHGKGRV